MDWGEFGKNIIGKKKNIEINQEMNDLKNEIVKSKNLLFELKDRVKALQLRVNGQ